MRPQHIACVALLLTLSRTAAAQAPPPTETVTSVECSEYVPPEERKDPTRLALRGVACFEAKQYLLALRHYRRARELSDANLLNAAIGRTFQELGYPFIARRYYRDYLHGKIEDTQGRAKIEARLAAVEEDLKNNGARVRVESSPPGATVYVVIDGSHWEELGATPLDLDMRPGKHSFIVERKGYVTHSAQIDIGKKQDRIVQARLVEEGAAFAVSGLHLRRSGIITMGAAVPFLIVGPSLYFIGRNQRGAVDELPAPERPDATHRATQLQSVGIVATVVGVAALGTGLTLYLAGRSVDHPDGPAPSTKTRTKAKGKTSWIPYFGTRSAGVLVRF